jgi:hypothetical protein
VNKAWWLPPAAALVAAVAMAGSSKSFVLELPQAIGTARRVVLELSEVRLPRNAAVVFRARVLEDNGVETPLGSVGMLAESNDAQGTRQQATLRIDVSLALKRWRQNHPGAREIRISVVPYVGAQPLTSLDWSAASAELTLDGR